MTLCRLISAIVIPALILVNSWAYPAFAGRHYIDPTKKDTVQQDGSQDFPWSDLQSAINSGEIKSGDEVVLGGGDYGSLEIRNRKMEQPTSVIVEPGKTAKFDSVIIHQSSNWNLKGLTVHPDRPISTRLKFQVQIDKGSQDITIDGFRILSATDIKDWTKEDWNTKAVSGIFIRAEDIVIKNNHLKNVRFGISARGRGIQVLNNHVENFSGDGLRGLSDDSVFEGNVVKNCYQVDRNHADGFQSWSVGPDGKVATGVVKNVILRRNLIINYEDPDQPFRCSLQGIGMFGGTYVNWRIENNIVLTDNWHGITVLGADDVRVNHNTVVDLNNFKPGPPGIRIEDHRDGTPSAKSVISNNIASIIKRGSGVLLLRNYEIGQNSSVFVDPDLKSYDIRGDSPVVDEGLGGLGVEEDFYGNPRPVGAKVDIGAVEFQNK